MAQYLSKENKRKISIGYIFLFLFFVWYTYNTNKELQHNITQSQINHIVSDFQFYNKTYSMINKDILIENPNYINDDELVDEYAKSTPLYIDRKQKQAVKYNLTMKFFHKDKRHDIDIENKIALLKEKKYIYSFNENSIELFGKVTDKGYVNIVKQLENGKYIKEVLNSVVLKVLLIGVLNIIVFFYLLTLFDEHKKDKDKMYKDYEQLTCDAKAIAMKDTLTGAATRMKFNDDLNNLLELASRFNEQVFTFTILDIDNFKKVNDTLGHDYGDVVLKEICKTVQKYMRKTDYLYRWGGEEFVILMPLNSLENTITYANRLREKIAEIKFEKLDQVTCSFGVVEFVKGDDETTIIKRADELLYKAKKNGKNRVEYK